jgi:hypothetical protein|tara:strand:- start:4073 stop:4423 length:351 start_codon:yes stop_codon:yes gene_type:complete
MLLKNIDSKMTPERYFEMQEQMGLEIIEEDIPPSLEDMPDTVLNAMDVFNSLGDRVYPEIGYIGKDYTSLHAYMYTYGVEKDNDFFFQILQWLDARAIKESSEKLKREYDKIKRKK